MRHTRSLLWAVVGVCVVTSVAQGGQGRPGTAPAEPAVAAPGVVGPPPPVPPATINRDPAGRATVRAVRVSSPLRVDGRLDDAIYGEVPPMSDFIQNDPK